jgi:hypothetical protein
MDHTSVIQTIDRYLSKDLTEPERLAFEEHMFDCPECAAQVEADFAMIADIKAVLREEPAKPTANWREWFRPISLVPAFAAMSLAVVVGYQNLVSIPAILRPQLLDTTPIVAHERRSAASIPSIVPSGPLFAATFEVASRSTYPAYVCEFQNEAKAVVASVSCGTHSTAEFTLSLLLPTSKFPAGSYTMILRPTSDKSVEISRYSFAVRNEDKAGHG